MKRLIILILLSVISATINCAHAAELGIFLGINSSYNNWFTTSPADQYVLRSTGSMGGLSLSFNQYQRFGFRVAALDYFLTQSGTSITQSKTMNINGSAPIALAVFDVNFDFSTNRHSFGIGYGYESLSSYSFSGTGTYPASSSASGVVLDGKDFWKNGWFDYVVLFFPHDNLNAYYSHYVFALGVGYEFGGKK